MANRASPRPRLVAGLLALPLLAGCGAGAEVAPSRVSAAPRAPSESGRGLAVREIDVPVNDFRLHVRVVGDVAAGPPIVAIPGGYGLSQEYLAPLARLATTKRAYVTFDPRGVGRSSRPKASHWTLEDFAADIDAVRRALGVQRMHLVGHSYSGLLAMRYATLHGDRLASLVLVDSIPPTGHGLDVAFERYLARKTELAKEGIVPMEMPAYDKEDCRAAMLSWTPVWFADPRSARARDFPGMACVDRSADLAIEGWDVRAALAHVTVPTAVIEPAETPFGLEMSEAGREALTRARVTKITLAACGHIPWLECEDAFFETLERFFASVP